MSTTMDTQSMSGADAPDGSCVCGTFLTHDVELLRETNSDGPQWWCCPDCWRRLVKIQNGEEVRA